MNARPTTDSAQGSSSRTRPYHSRNRKGQGAKMRAQDALRRKHNAAVLAPLAAARAAILALDFTTDLVVSGYDLHTDRNMPHWGITALTVEDHTLDEYLDGLTTLFPEEELFECSKIPPATFQVDQTAQHPPSCHAGEVYCAHTSEDCSTEALNGLAFLPKEEEEEVSTVPATTIPIFNDEGDFSRLPTEVISLISTYLSCKERFFLSSSLRRLSFVPCEQAAPICLGYSCEVKHSPVHFIRDTSLQPTPRVQQHTPYNPHLGIGPASCRSSRSNELSHCVCYHQGLHYLSHCVNFNDALCLRFVLGYRLYIRELKRYRSALERSNDRKLSPDLRCKVYGQLVSFAIT